MLHFTAAPFLLWLNKTKSITYINLQTISNPLPSFSIHLYITITTLKQSFIQGSTQVISCKPPSTTRTLPVTYGDSRRKATACATSWGSPNLPRRIAFFSWSSSKWAVISVWIKPKSREKYEKLPNLQLNLSSGFPNENYKVKSITSIQNQLPILPSLSKPRPFDGQDHFFI